jgi:polygalacturonase
MKFILSPVIVLLALITGHAADFPVAGFGATGDGKTDDGPAIRKAVEAAMVAGAGSRVVFEKIQKGYSHPVDVYESIGRRAAACW